MADNKMTAFLQKKALGKKNKDNKNGK